MTGLSSKHLEGIEKPLVIDVEKICSNCKKKLNQHKIIKTKHGDRLQCSTKVKNYFEYVDLTEK